MHYLKGFSAPAFQNTIFYFLLSIVLLPIWISKYPAMIDLPQHVAQISALSGIIDGNNFYNKIYEINWFTPYIFTNLLMILLSFVFSPLTSIKLGVSFYIVIIPIFTGLIAEKLNKPKEVRLITIPFLYSVSFQWGFVPFLMSISLGIMWIYYFLAINNKPGSILNIVISFVLMYSHAIAWGLVFINLLYISLREEASLSKLKGFVFLSFPIVFLIIWMFIVKNNEPSSIGGAYIYYDSIYYKAFSLVGANLMGNDIALGLVKLLLIYYLLREVVVIRCHRNKFLELSVLSVCIFFLFPSVFFSTAFFSDRLLVIFPVFVALSISSIVCKKKYLIIIVCATLLSSASRIRQVMSVDDGVNNYYSISNYIREGSSVVFFTNPEDYGNSQYKILVEPYYLWLPQILTSTKDVVMDFNFAYFFPEAVRYKKSSRSELETLSYMTRYDYPDIMWEEFLEYDYILIRDCSIKTKDIIDKLPSSVNISSKNINCWHLINRGT